MKLRALLAAIPIGIILGCLCGAAGIHGWQASVIGMLVGALVGLAAS